MRGSRVFALVGAVLVAALGAAVPARADDQAPIVTLDQPARLNPQTVSGVAGVAAGDGPSVTLEFYPGTTAAGTAAATVNTGKADETGEFTAAVPAVDDGTWTVRAIQGDNAGNTGVSESWTFGIDIKAPQVELTAPDAVTGEAVPHFEGIAGTADGDLSAITLTITGPDQSPTTFPASAKGGWFSADAPEALADGTYKVVASQADELGHVGTSSRTFVIDTTPPVVTPTGPDTDAKPATNPIRAPTPSPAGPAAPQPVATRTAAGLKITSATALRHGRTITLKLRGAAAKTATGQVTVTVAGVRTSATAKLTKGAWTVTLRITKTAKSSLKVTVAYGGDGGFTAGTAKRTVRVRR